MASSPNTAPSWMMSFDSYVRPRVCACIDRCGRQSLLSCARIGATQEVDTSVPLVHGGAKRAVFACAWDLLLIEDLDVSSDEDIPAPRPTLHMTNLPHRKASVHTHGIARTFAIMGLRTCVLARMVPPTGHQVLQWHTRTTSTQKLLESVGACTCSCNHERMHVRVQLGAHSYRHAHVHALSYAHLHISVHTSVQRPVNMSIYLSMYTQCACTSPHAHQYPCQCARPCPHLLARLLIFLYTCL